MRAWVSLRHPDSARARAFHTGLARLGYTIASGTTTNPGPKDILVSWNLLRDAVGAADAFKARGLPVIVTENALWGNDFMGGDWLTVARDSHNLAGKFPLGGPERWDNLGPRLKPIRDEEDTVILPQRGIGQPPVAMPRGWAESALARYGGRVRLHPGKRETIPLEQDLHFAGRVITWGSGAAVKALMWGIPVISELPNWVAEQDNTEAGRLAMLRRLAWCTWTLDEIATGEPFKRLLA